MKRVLALLMATAMLVSLAGCGGGSKAEETTSEKVLTLVKHADLNSMDTQKATDGLSFEVLAATLDGLYYTAEDGSAQPALAENTEISEDGLTYTFTIRDAKWSNGDKVTAYDFEYGWKRLANPDTASEYAYMLDVAGIKNGWACATGDVPLEQLGVKAVDDETFVVELDHVVPFFIKILSFPSFYPANQAFVEAQGDEYALTPEATLACGPYKLTEWYPGSSFKVSKNESYYDSAAVKLDAINFKVVLDSQSAVLEYESGATDYVRLTGELVEKYANNPDYEITLGSYLWYLSVNQKKGDLGNKNLNLAIALAYDRDQIANYVLKDGSIPANFMIPKKLATGPDGKDFRETAPQYFTEGKDKAKAYWAKAQEELGKTESSFELLFEDTESSKKVAEFLKSEIETTLEGVTVELKSQPKKTRLKLMDKGEYDVCLTRWGPDYQDPMTYLELFTTEASYNYGYYSDSEYDALIDACTSGQISLEERWAKMIEAEGVLLEGGGPIPVYQTGASTLWNPKVIGYVNNSVGVPYTYKYADIVE
jgi:oligopeptide transport system substrate-binding protein